MRIPVVCTVFALGLLGCRQVTAYLNADELAHPPSGATEEAPCNHVEQHGEVVSLARSRAPAPAPAGGTIEDGTYVLTSSTLHTKDNPHGNRTKLVDIGKITILVRGSTSEMVLEAVNGRERRTTVERASSGTVTTLHTTCASPRPTDPASTTTTGFTATSRSFQYITPGPAGTVVATYTKL